MLAALLAVLAAVAHGQTIPAVYYKLYYVYRDDVANVSRIETVSSEARQKRDRGKKSRQRKKRREKKKKKEKKRVSGIRGGDTRRRDARDSFRDDRIGTRSAPS